MAGRSNSCRDLEDSSSKQSKELVQKFRGRTGLVCFWTHCSLEWREEVGEGARREGGAGFWSEMRNHRRALRIDYGKIDLFLLPSRKNPAKAKRWNHLAIITTCLRVAWGSHSRASRRQWDQYKQIFTISCFKTLSVGDKRTEVLSCLCLQLSKEDNESQRKATEAVASC